MSDLRQAAQQALEALEDMLGWQSLAPQTIQEAAKGRAAALRAALAEPENWELRRLREELERCKQVCAATSESWRIDAEKWKGQRDALLSALKGMLLHMGMDEDEWNKPTFDQARAAIKAVEEGK